MVLFCIHLRPFFIFSFMPSYSNNINVYSSTLSVFVYSSLAAHSCQVPFPCFHKTTLYNNVVLYHFDKALNLFLHIICRYSVLYKERIFTRGNIVIFPLFTYPKRCISDSSQNSSHRQNKHALSFLRYTLFLFSSPLIFAVTLYIYMKVFLAQLLSINEIG